tara:strand:+ start:813 stop:1592 length:780 start_codon:yes stop_codon:yes gene_type:complete
MKHHATLRQGFSLVEISVVLIIIALVVGGIMTGKHLLRASQIRSVATEYQLYRSASQQFIETYKAHPGDFTQATDYWGSMTNCTGASPSGTGTQTCNGNGSRMIELPSAAGRVGESFTFWQHLSNAGLITGRFTGKAGPGNLQEAILEVNIPDSKVTDAGWHVRLYGNAGDTTHFATQNDNLFMYGRPTIYGTSWPALTPKEAWSIDTKLDDGLPGQGFVIAYLRDTCTNSTSATDYASTYLLSETDVACALQFTGWDK